MKCTLLSILFTFSLFGQVTIEQVQAELNLAQSELQQAKEMFNPWYVGPLLTPSATTYTPGKFGIQPYFFAINTHGIYSSSGSSSNIPDILTLNPVFIAFAGINDRVDITGVVQWFYNKQSGIHDSGFGDFDLSLGFALLKETPSLPALKFFLTQCFPTGKYEKLSPIKAGLDATGLGSYLTTVGLSFSKIVFWSTKHPMNIRAATQLSLPSDVKVEGFNTYGGGFGTKGTVVPGKTFSSSFALEYSFTQKWVFANDLVYAYSTRTKFHGNPGTIAVGNPIAAVVGGPFSDNLSWAPAIEYNPTTSLNFIVGGWMSLWGRNSGNFVAGVASVYVGF